jgi:hypothetical protein
LKRRRTREKELSFFPRVHRQVSFRGFARRIRQYPGKIK